MIFDERFFIYGEDLDLCERLRAGDWKIAYTPSIRIVHHEGRSLARQTTRVQMNKLRGLRAVFAMRNAPLLIPLYDVVVVAGFSMRAVAFALAGLMRPGRGYGERAAASRRFAAEAFGTLLGRG
jgi:GT2 family glycosyltransferase